MKTHSGLCAAVALWREISPDRAQRRKFYTTEYVGEGAVGQDGIGALRANAHRGQKMSEGRLQQNRRRLWGTFVSCKNMEWYV